MKFLLPLSLLTALIAAPAFADCTVPPDNVVVPGGAKATKDEMIAAQHAVKDYNAAVKDYIDCLGKEMDAKLAAGGEKMKDADRKRINSEYAARQNTVVDAVQKVADKFNVELRAWKAENAPPPPAAQ